MKRTITLFLFGWWAMDPLAERHYWVSPYASCRDNPVRRLDPNGLDDIFSQTGIFQYRTKTGTSVLMDTGNGNLVNITDIDFRDNKDALKNIASHYMSKVDKNDFVFNVSDADDGAPEGVALSNDTGTNRYDIYINDNGKVNSTLGDCYDFENSAYHENRHRYDSKTHGGTLGETIAVLQETEHPSWNNVSMSYIHAQASYAAESFNNYIKEMKKNKKQYIHINRMHYVKMLNDAFMGLAHFALRNGFITTQNSLKDVICIGIK